MTKIFINDREISRNKRPYIIAELSGNHNGDINRALLLIKKAYEAGVDAVKLQTYTAETITLKHKGSDFKINEGIWEGQYLYDLYEKAHTPWDWHEKLFQEANNLGLDIFSSPFDNSAVDFLENLKVPAYKIASFELLDLPLVSYIASKKKPIILSTGMASEIEIKEAIKVAKTSGANDIALLHCVSGYPTPIKEINLKMISKLYEKFDCPIGLSDHTMGTIVPTASIAMGTCIIEKHFTLSRKEGGPDSQFSLEPDELKDLVKNCRNAWLAIGKGEFKIAPSEKENLKFRRSLYVVEDIGKDELFSDKNIKSIRPGYGLHPKLKEKVIGKKSTKHIKRGTALSKDLIKNFSN